MGDFNVPDNANSTIQFGHDFCDIQTTQLKTGTTAYPGSLLTDDTTVGESKVCTDILPPKGWLVLEDTPHYIRKKRTTDTYDGAFANDDDVAYTRSAIGAVIKARIATPSNLSNGDFVANWVGGELIGPIKEFGHGLYLEIPFTKNATAVKPGDVQPSVGMITSDMLVSVTAAVASSTVSAGDDSTSDQLLDAVPTTATTWAPLNLVDATAASITLGASLTEVEILDATGTPVYFAVRLSPGYEWDGAKYLYYKTSSHACAGSLFFHLAGEHFQKVGQAVEDIDASSAATTGLIKSLI